jgi:hypothetical protein
MSTAPVVTLPAAETWIKHHERLFLALIAGTTLWFAIGRVDSLLVKHDNANLQQAQVAAQVQQSKDEALAQQVAQDKAAYTSLNAEVMARDAQLTQMQAQLVAALSGQQKKDQTLPPTDLVARWNTLVPTASAKVTSDGVTLPEGGAVATVVELEKSPVLTQQLANDNEELVNAQKLIAAEGQQITDRDLLITGLRTKADADAKVCDVRVKVETDKIRKARRRWFIIGYVTGFISRQVIKTETGL